MSRDDESQMSEVQRRAVLRQLAAARAARRGIAIVGVDCRLPGAPNFAALRSLLREGSDAITEVPLSRWKAAEIYHPDFEHRGTVTTRWGGFIEGVDHFDAGFFGISPREAAVMDPQHRLLLSCAWHALEDAGLRREDLAGSRTGVYLAQYQSDYAQLALAQLEDIDAYTASGTHHGIAANRLSYLLDLRGPSVVVDTACSSSLVALHLAMRALRRGEIEQAIVAGVNLMINPEETVALSRWGVMAADGRCKTFDHRADGFVRGEGVAVLVLARMERAQASGLCIRAELLGSAVNQDGRSNGLTAPNGLAQAEVLREALRDAKLEPQTVTMIEAHGTGTALGDPIEVEALAEVYGEGERPCYLTSIKSKIGHLEAAAGLAGVLEALVCIETGEVAATLHIERLNPALPLAGTRLEVASRTRAWPALERRVAGVSAFGMGGTNAHVLLAQAAAGREPPALPEAHRCRRWALLPLSAEHPGALRELAAAWSRWLRETPARDVQLVCAAAAQRRSALRWRVAVVGRSCVELAEALERWLVEGGEAPGRGAVARRGAALLCPGQGGQWLGMGRILARTEPAFANALARCDGVISSQAGFSILAELEHPRLDAIEIVQPLLFSLSVAYAALWRSVGLEPAALVGHSMGEAAAAAISGALSLEQAAWVIVERSQRMARLRGRGGMMVVGLAQLELEPHLDGTPLELAAINGPRSCVVSGPSAALDLLDEALRAGGVELRRVEVEVASHHAGMDTLEPELRASFAQLEPRASEHALFSTVLAAAVSGTELDASYWFRNLREPVRLWPVIELLLARGVRDFIELGPHPVLLPALREGFEALGEHAETIPSGRRASERTDDEHSWLAALALLWARGHALDLAARHTRAHIPLELPRYPFQESRHWLDGVQRGRRSGRPQAPLPQGLEAWFHQLEWQPLAAQPATRDPQEPLAHIVIFGRSALADALTQAMAASGEGEIARARTLEELRAGRGGEPRRVLAALDTPPECSAAGVSETLAAQALSLGALMRELEGTRAEVWLVTHGGAPQLPARSPLAAARFGLARVASVEHERWCRGLIDLDGGLEPGEACVPLVSLAFEASLSEPVLALRDGARLGLRLRARAQPACAPLELDPGRTYLVAGGFGGVGRHMCRWLADRGARHILIATRNPLPPRALWCAEDARIAFVLELESRGVQVHVRKCDIGSKMQISALLGEWRKERRPKVSGLIHAAGSQEHLALAELEHESFAAHTRAKIEGSEALLAQLEQLDFAVLCSSAASMLRSPLLASYVAACSYQDALAEQARALGRRAISVGWGVWPEGMTARYADKTGRSAPGFAVMSPAGALACMERALEAGLGHCGVMAVDWSAWAEVHAHEAQTALMRGLLEQPQRRAEALSLDLEQLARADTQARCELMLAYLVRSVAGVARMVPGQVDPLRGAAEQGLDSLMAVELRNRMAAALGWACSIADILRSESLTTLAALLATRHGEQLESAAAQAESGEGHDDAWESVTI